MFESIAWAVKSRFLSFGDPLDCDFHGSLGKNPGHYWGMEAFSVLSYDSVDGTLYWRIKEGKQDMCSEVPLKHLHLELKMKN